MFRCCSEIPCFAEYIFRYSLFAKKNTHFMKWLVSLCNKSKPIRQESFLLLNWSQTKNITRSKDTNTHTHTHTGPPLEGLPVGGSTVVSGKGTCPLPFLTSQGVYTSHIHYQSNHHQIASVIHLLQITVHKVDYPKINGVGPELSRRWFHHPSHISWLRTQKTNWYISL